MGRIFEALQSDADKEAEARGATTPRPSYSGSGIPSYAMDKKFDPVIVEDSKWRRDLQGIAIETEIELGQSSGPGSVILFAGVESGVGASTVAYNFAELVKRSRSDKKALYIRFSPAISGASGHDLLRILEQGTQTTAELVSTCYDLDINSLYIELDSRHMENVEPHPGLIAFINEARARFHWILLDVPPLPVFPLSTTLSSVIDGAVIVARYGSTRIPSISSIAHTLESLRIRPLGVVLNRREYPIPSSVMKWL